MILEKNKLTGETKKYYYDAENRMTKYEHQASDISPVDITAEYKYDIFGRRLQKNVNNVITNFFWENDTMTYELDEQYKPIRKYITGLGMDDYEGHLEYSEVTDWSAHIFNPQYNPPWYTYMKDQVGTVYKVYDHKNHSIADSRAYDSFGNLVNQTGTTKTPLGFQGKYYDQESGLNYFYHRYYNPAIGRFTSEDPIGFGGGLNLHRFVNNNPTNFIDPTGNKTDADSFPIYIPLQNIKISGSTFSWQSFKEMICGDVKLCKKDSFWDNVWENFKQTNEFIPGILAPSFSGFITAGKFANYMESVTFMRWMFGYGFGGATLGGATFTGVETGIIAGMTSFANWALVSTAFETGVLVGSILRTMLCD
jgi:RHS repeat-associated protein